MKRSEIRELSATIAAAPRIPLRAIRATTLRAPQRMPDHRDFWSIRWAGRDTTLGSPPGRAPVRLMPFVCAVGLLSSTAIASTDMSSQDFTDLQGQWTCHGVFPASGKTIDSTVRFALDLDGKALVKHHDDTSPPALYHALEAWGYDAKSHRYNATILDSFGGARVFSSEGWKEGRLIWSSAPDVKPVQRFVYSRESSQGLRIDWEVEREGTLVIGDTLHCSHST